MQQISSLSNFVSYFLISIPGMYYLCFDLDMGLNGIFLGYNMGSLANLIFNAYLSTFKEWKMYDFKNMVD